MAKRTSTLFSDQTVNPDLTQSLASQVDGLGYLAEIATRLGINTIAQANERFQDILAIRNLMKSEKTTSIDKAFAIWQQQQQPKATMPDLEEGFRSFSSKQATEGLNALVNGHSELIQQAVLEGVMLADQIGDARELAFALRLRQRDQEFVAQSHQTRQAVPISKASGLLESVSGMLAKLLPQSSEEVAQEALNATQKALPGFDHSVLSLTGTLP